MRSHYAAEQALCGCRMFMIAELAAYLPCGILADQSHSSRSMTRASGAAVAVVLLYTYTMSVSGRALVSIVVGALLLGGCTEQSGSDPVDLARMNAMDAALAHYPHYSLVARFGMPNQPNRLETALKDPTLATLSEDDSRQFVAGVVDWLHGDGWQPTWVSCTESDAPTNGAMEALWVATAYRLVDGVSYAMRIEGKWPGYGPLMVTIDLEAPDNDAPADSLARPVPPTLNVGETCLKDRGQIGPHGTEVDFVTAAGVRRAPAERRPSARGIDPARARGDRSSTGHYSTRRIRGADRARSGRVRASGPMT